MSIEVVKMVENIKLEKILQFKNNLSKCVNVKHKEYQNKELILSNTSIKKTIGFITSGKATIIKTDENGSWVLIAIDELTKLWYNTEYVELTDEKYVKTTKNSDDNEELSVDDIKEQIKRSVTSEMSSDAVGGG